MSLSGCLNPVGGGEPFRFGNGTPIRPAKLPAHLPYLLAANPTGRPKPRAYRTLQHLARAIQRERGSHGLDSVNTTVSCFGEMQTRLVVALHLLSDTGDRVGFIGYAWLLGEQREVLQAAILTAEPRDERRLQRAA